MDREPDVWLLQESTLDDIMREVKDKQDFKITDLSVDIARNIIKVKFPGAHELSVQELADKLYDNGIGEKILPKVKIFHSVGCRDSREKRSISE